MILTPALLKKTTGGKWYNLGRSVTFSGVRVNIERIVEGDLCFATTREHWGVDNTEVSLDRIHSKGAAATVITDKLIAENTSHPVLLVDNAKAALKKTALYLRDNYRIDRVLVSGTEGKTGFKNMLYQVLSLQLSIHANLDSSNLDVPIMCSLASLKQRDTIEVIEASIAQADVGARRSQLVKPNFCILTEVGYEHVSSHGSQENLINNKASIVDGLTEGGVCVLNRNSVHFNEVREAIYKRKYVDIRTFGANSKCHSRLISARFLSDKQMWQVEASVAGKRINYNVPLIGEHIPLASVSVLLMVHLLGGYVKKAARDFRYVTPHETMGRLSKIDYKGGFYFYDHSHRASILSYKSAFSDLERFSVKRQGRKIAVVGQMMNIGDISNRAHRELGELIMRAGVDILITVGENAKAIHSVISPPELLHAHGDNYKEIEDRLISLIKQDDILFVKGHHRIWLKDLAEKIYQLGVVNEIQ